MFNFTISNNGIITMTRGDTIKVPIFINAGDNTDYIRYTLEEGDTLYFGIMEPEAPFEKSLIRKVLTKDDLNQYGDVEIALSLNDTQYLQTGTYYYEAKLKQIRLLDNGQTSEVVSTVIPRRKFIIVE